MKKYCSIVVLLTLFCSCTKQSNKTAAETSSQIVAPLEEGTRIIVEQSEPDTLKGSLKAKAMGSIGNVGITINYYSPAVRGRIIWGGLVPFDKVWVTGAHRATNIDFNQEVEIGGVTIAPNKYALFTIPGKEEWTIIINKNWDQHLVDDYDQKQDIVRIKVKPETEDAHQERLRYVIEQEGEQAGEIVIYWEKQEVSLPISTFK
jgi:hypothetical protein